VSEDSGEAGGQVIGSLDIRGTTGPDGVRVVTLSLGDDEDGHVEVQLGPEQAIDVSFALAKCAGYTVAPVSFVTSCGWDGGEPMVVGAFTDEHGAYAHVESEDFDGADEQRVESWAGAVRLSSMRRKRLRREREWDKWEPLPQAQGGLPDGVRH
jgi:hypothetical protein